MRASFDDGFRGGGAVFEAVICDVTVVLLDSTKDATVHVDAIAAMAAMDTLL